MDISIILRGCQPDCLEKLVIKTVLRGVLVNAHAKGFSTALHGALHATGSYWSNGVSGFSFSGVYNEPIGTTSREASLTVRQLQKLL